MKKHILKGNICSSGDINEIKIYKNSFLVCIDGICRGIFEKVPSEYCGIEITDYGDMIIIPGMSDLHVHASQYAYRGTGMDMELLDWLEINAFPEEGRFSDMEYAACAYDIFADDLLKTPTTRLCAFATVHKDATLYLMEALEKRGFRGYAGKVNMDRNCPDYLREKDVSCTEEWIRECSTVNIRPAVTPRFIPSCTDSMMEELGRLCEKYNLPVQSHISENKSEIELVHSLCDVEFYAQGYDRYGLLNDRTVMAHCIYSSDEELALMKERGVFIAHCPESNMNIASGIAPVRKYIDSGQKVGLASDVAGGSDLSLFGAMTHALRCSGMYWRLVDESCRPLTFEEVFYMATKGGGSFFGKTGSFEPGYDFDAVVLDDSNMCHPRQLSVRQRLERIIYLSDSRNIHAKYICGNRVL